MQIYANLLAAINNYVFGHRSSFEHAHFRVNASSAKQTWRLDTKITNFFFISVHQSETVFFLNQILFFFFFLQRKMVHGLALLQKKRISRQKTYIFFFFASIFSFFRYFFKIFAHFFEIAFFKIRYFLFFFGSHYLHRKKTFE